MLASKGETAKEIANELDERKKDIRLFAVVDTLKRVAEFRLQLLLQVNLWGLSHFFKCLTVKLKLQER